LGLGVEKVITWIVRVSAVTPNAVEKKNRRQKKKKMKKEKGDGRKENGNRL
jgi:hypothetical protein|tara:strand:- start:1838 stop:1990 length:153 start_codon:yes stop_codon:yes gene_type:complete